MWVPYIYLKDVRRHQIIDEKFVAVTGMEASWIRGVWEALPLAEPVWETRIDD